MIIPFSIETTEISGPNHFIQQFQFFFILFFYRFLSLRFFDALQLFLQVLSLWIIQSTDSFNQAVSFINETSDFKQFVPKHWIHSCDCHPEILNRRFSCDFGTVLVGRAKIHKVKTNIAVKFTFLNVYSLLLYNSSIKIITYAHVFHSIIKLVQSVLLVTAFMQWFFCYSTKRIYRSVAITLFCIFHSTGRFSHKLPGSLDLDNLSPCPLISPGLIPLRVNLFHPMSAGMDAFTAALLSWQLKYDTGRSTNTRRVSLHSVIMGRYRNWISGAWIGTLSLFSLY